MDNPLTVDITTTSVGRDTLKGAYRTFFEHVTFSGSYRVFVTLDPAYAVPESEVADTLRFLDELPKTFPQVREVVADRLPRQVGLQGALSILCALTTNRFGVHLEDDWEFTGPVDLDLLIEEIERHDSTQIVFTNSHVARAGTFERPGEVEVLPGSAAGLLRLTQASWAANYLPLCPHLHRTDRWAPTIARALVLTDHFRCPDERVRERIVTEQTADRHNVLWTPQIVAKDVGREWLKRRGRFKALTPDHVLAPSSERPSPADGRVLTLTRSTALLSKAEAIIPGITQTYLKRPVNFAPGEYPVYAERGDGALLWDVDGNSYVDFVLALGAASLGHNHPAISNVVRERVGRGTLLSLPGASELAASQELVAALPGVDQVRFLKTGAEACAAAIRLARHRTGRDFVLLVGYHGWHDQLIGPSSGVPAAVEKLSRRMVVNTKEDEERFLGVLDELGSHTAAVLFSTPYHRVLSASFLQELRALCDRHGSLLVFDEIVTGFRLSPAGLAQLYGVRADLLCFSKGLAAGMPLAALAGPRQVMNDLGALRVSTTFGGELLSLEAMRVALREYGKSDYYQRIALLGRQFKEGLNEHAHRLGHHDIVMGYDPMPCLQLHQDPAEHERLAIRFLAGMARHGFLLRRDVNFISAVHSAEHIESAVCAAGEVLAEVLA